MTEIKNKLWDVDEQLFASMEGKYLSTNEANFFKNLHYKQVCEPTLANELLVSEYENDDEIYLVRVEYEEYLVGHGIDKRQKEVHVMNLSEALAVNLNDVGLGRSVTLLDWLRSRDYTDVKYNRNHDFGD